MELDTEPSELAKVVSVHRPHTHLSTFLLCLRKGSLDETRCERGMLHLIEHLIFRCASYGAKISCVEDIERLGAFVSGRTTLDTTEFLLRVGSSRALECLGRVCNMVFGGVFDPASFELERQVGLEEIRLDAQSFAAQASRRVIAHLFGSACSAEITGSTDEVERIELTALSAFYERTYVAGDFVLAHVGSHDCDQVADVLEQHCRAGRAIKRNLLSQRAKRPQHVTLDRDGQEPMALLAYRGVGYTDSNSLALQVLCQALKAQLARTATRIGVANIRLRLRLLRRYSIVEILVIPEPPIACNAAAVCQTVDELLTSVTISDSELCTAMRRVSLETCVGQDDQDELATQLLSIGLSQYTRASERGPHAMGVELRESINVVRAATFENPIVVSSY